MIIKIYKVKTNINKKEDIHYLIEKEIELMKQYNSSPDNILLNKIAAIRRLQIKLLNKKTKT